MRIHKTSYHICAVLALVTAILVGCHDRHHHVHIIIPPTGDIEGYAYFPYQDPWGNYPVYYDTGNELILVTLYDADDIYYAFPLRDYLTATSGYFRFSDVTPDWYYLTAEAQEYDPVFDVTDFYWAETYDFEVRVGDLHVWELFLEYDGSVPGFAIGVKALDTLRQKGTGEITWNSDLQLFHDARSERFRHEGRERPIEFRLKSQSEHVESQRATE